ncbi:uncharacterized protein DNG_05244 [Cephalotrichum gorgonifer]|uniref:F-box domain-containing protein n=1 Tax=Cephalotrichum gorgonifer TaxID=2041049 RepID=A0AAE8MXI3_9PEZI|nr:uncharacterized protein DNG_05244 [Cephalotrichum gorgonifer]
MPIILTLIRKLRLAISFVFTFIREPRETRGTTEYQDDIKAVVGDGNKTRVTVESQGDVSVGGSDGNEKRDRKYTPLARSSPKPVQSILDTEDGDSGARWRRVLDDIFAETSSRQQVKTTPSPEGTAPPTQRELAQEDPTQEEPDRDMQRERAHTSLDPLVAARLHNIHHSPVHRIPDELLLKIVLLLARDEVSYHILWRVCHLFQRIMKSPECERSARHICFADDTRFSSTVTYRRPRTSYLPFMRMSERILELVRRDLLCKDCLLAPRAARPGSSSGCRFDVDRPCRNHRTYPATSPIQIRCPHCPSHLHCAGCGADHLASAFSSRMRRKHWAQRLCMGREGEVRLCEHVAIKWASIEALVAEWGRRVGGHATASPFPMFRIQCDHPSHNFPCPAQGAAPTPPRATLVFRAGAPRRAIMQLDWEPHTQGLAPLPGTNGRIQAASARRAFQELRQDAARFIVPAPSMTSGSPPEMALFQTDAGCECLSYEGPTVDEEALPAPSPPQATSPAPQPRNIPRFPCRVSGTSHHIFSHTVLRSSTSLLPCYKCREQAHVRYRRYIPLGEVPDRGAYIPSHAWFHALDMERFAGAEDDDGGRICTDERCVDYHRHRLPRESHHAEISRPCGYGCPPWADEREM